MSRAPTLQGESGPAVGGELYHVRSKRPLLDNRARVCTTVVEPSARRRLTRGTAAKLKLYLPARDTAACESSHFKTSSPSLSEGGWEELHAPLRLRPSVCQSDEVADQLDLGAVVRIEATIRELGIGGVLRLRAQKVFGLPPVPWLVVTVAIGRGARVRLVAGVALGANPWPRSAGEVGHRIRALVWVREGTPIRAGRAVAQRSQKGARVVASLGVAGVLVGTQGAYAIPVGLL
mmetsp:Transcript_84230/g.212391  ORF Transcript_84230/g.212391 Transcript_84230/m.212391 type:complete len:234 (+) Transcript_84230:77-778(+)